MTDDLYSQIKSEIGDRTEWSNKQATWYNLRFDGLGRTSKPYPNAPDTHVALCDTMIDKLRPFYLSQVYGQERLACFASNVPMNEGEIGAAEELFDYTLKQQTNFERALFTAVDHMLMYGRGPVKVFWNARTKKIEFSAVRPIYIIVPKHTEELGTADWLVHVMHLSVAQYKQNENFKQNDDFIKSISGRGIESDNNGNQQEQDKLSRQGITFGQNDNQVVLWEVYRRDGDDIMVDTISPVLGADGAVRDSFGMPYPHGEFPFADLRYEITDPDYYSPRGVPEILAEDELYLCKLRNHQLQFMDFHAQPTYSNAGTMPNMGNLTVKPGAVLPTGVTPNEPFNAPTDYMQQLQYQRAMAEDRIQVPNLSASEHLSGDHGAKGQVTATQIDAIVTQSNTGNDMRARIYRLQLAEIYRQAWCIYCWANPSGPWELENFETVPKTAIHTDYRIRPSGSADGMSKEQRMKRAISYFQLTQGNPYIPLGKSTKWLLAQDSAEMVDELYEDPGISMQNEGEKQGLETLLMEGGRPVSVNPEDDDKAHIADMASWVQHKQQSMLPIAPDTAQRMLMHGQGHAQQIKQKKDKEGMALMAKVQPQVQFLQGLVAAAQQQQQQQGMMPQQPQMPQQAPMPTQTPPAMALA